MYKRNPLRPLLFFVSLLFAATVSAQFVYEQPFDNTVDQAPIENVGWNYAASDGLARSLAGLRQYGNLSNAGGTGGVPGLAYNWNGTGGERAILTWYAGGGLLGGIAPEHLQTFSMVIGHNHAGVESRFLIAVEGAGWFVTTQAWSGVNIGAVSNFTDAAVPVSFTFTRAGAAWRALAFDGNTGSSSSGFAVFSGAQPGLESDLPAGNIVAVGVYHYNPNNASSRYDDFRVTAASSPNNDTRLLSVLGLVDTQPGNETGTAGDPITWSINAPLSTDALGLADIAVPPGAHKQLFAAPGFSPNAEITGGATLPLGESGGTAYIRVTAADESTALHYAVGITRPPSFIQTPQPLAWIYDAVGDGQRDGRPPLPLVADLNHWIDLQPGEPDGTENRWDVWSSRHTLADPLRVLVQQSDDLQTWRTITVLPPPEPVDEGKPVKIPVQVSGSPVFVRGAVADARELPELTPESARNFWARFISGALTATNAAGTMGNGTRGADTRGRIFGTGDYELVMRTLWSVGAWFYHVNRPATLDWVNPLDGSTGTVDLAAFARNAIRHGTDPHHPQRWPHSFNGSTLGTMQPSVEAANVAWVAWAMQRGAAQGNAESPWNEFSATDRTNLQNWLALHGSVPNSSSVNHGNIYNWNLFFVLNQEARKRLNQAGYSEFAWTQDQIDNGRAAVDALHRGGGWYSDFGSFDVFDEYIPWTFATHLILHAHMNAEKPDSATQIPGRPFGRTRAAILAELRAFLALNPYFYDMEGANPEFGRSTTYKVSRLAGLVIAYAVDSLAATEAPESWTEPVFPAEITPGQVRRLVRLHINHYLRNESFHWPSGLLREGLTPDTPNNFMEPYSVRGSTYWNMILFTGLWLIPDNDPFWTEPEDPIPAQVSDYALWLDTPGWMFSHLRERGDLRKYVLRAAYRQDAWAEAPYHPKYAKFAYSSRFGFLLPSATRGDQMIRIGNRERRRNDDGDVWPMIDPTADSPMVLRTAHIQGDWRVSTLIFLRGPLDVRVHRITGPGSTQTISDGSFPLGHASDESPPAAQTGPNWMYMESSRGAILHAALTGFTEVKSASGTGNHSRDPAWRRLWAEAPSGILPATFSSLQVAQAAPFDPAALRAQILDVTHDSETATVHFSDGTTWTVPFLP